MPLLNAAQTCYRGVTALSTCWSDAHRECVLVIYNSGWPWLHDVLIPSVVQRRCARVFVFGIEVDSDVIGRQIFAVVGVRIGFAPSVQRSDGSNDAHFTVGRNRDVVHGFVRLQESFILDVSHAILTVAGHWKRFQDVSNCHHMVDLASYNKPRRSFHRSARPDKLLACRRIGLCAK